jgi:hypothetical protein
MAQEAAVTRGQKTSLDAGRARVKEAEAITSEAAKEAKTDAMLKEQGNLLESAD